MIPELDTNSLYIITEPLSEGYFHWAMVEVDGTGMISRHEWARDEPFSPNQDTYYETREEYTGMHPPRLALIYAKVRGYRSHRAAFAEICTAAHPTATIPKMEVEGREVLPSQQWVMQVLKALEGRGLVAREAAVAEVEGGIARWSEEKELLYLQLFMDGVVYVPPVVTI